MRKIASGLVGVVSAIGADGAAVLLAAGDEVPEGVVVGEHALEPEVEPEVEGKSRGRAKA